MLDAERWAAVPFHFWSVVFFFFGGIVGSFLNVCIHRLPRDESVISPPSHCPQCQQVIPWRLNIPLLSWLWLRGRCAFCGAPISARYFLVELLTGMVFLNCWLAFGPQSTLLALAYCLLLAGFIAATFIDLEHFIIPDGITLGGVAAGFLCSFVVPGLHRVSSPVAALQQSFWGMALGAGIIYLFLRGGKLVFGRHRLKLAPGSRVLFTETSLVLPAEEIPYGDLFYRKSDAITLQARTVEMVDRCYRDVAIRLTQTQLEVGGVPFDTAETPGFEAVTDEVVVPREAMGLGDVKFMAAIGAFLGWTGVLFSLLVSAMLGSVVGITLIALRKREWSSRIPYGPYIALAASVWVFAGDRVLQWWLGR